MSDNGSPIIVENAQEKSRALLIKLLRAGGVVFLLMGIGALTNVFDLPFLRDDLVRMVFGGSLCFVALMEIFIVPIIMKKGWENADAAKRDN